MGTNSVWFSNFIEFMRSFPILAVLAITSMALPLRGAPAVIISLDSVAKRIQAHNPDLAAARMRIREALGRVSQSGRLANPELETLVENNARFREGRLQMEFSQRFPVTDRLRLEKEISLTELKASEAEVREVERQLVATAREQIVKLLALRHQRELLESQSANASELARTLADIAGRGEGSALDAGQAKLEGAGLGIEAAGIKAGEIELIGQLKALLGMRLGEPLSVTGVLPDPVLPTGGGNFSDRPDLQAAKLQSTAAAQEVALEQTRKYEDVEGGIFAAVERSEDVPKGYDNEGIVGLRVKIPLPLWNQNTGAVEQARAKQQRHELETVALARGIQQEADAALAEMKQWQAVIQQISLELMPVADEQIKMTETLYQEGRGDFQSVLRTRGKRLELAAARIDALRGFHLARVRHESAFAKY